MKNGLLFSSNDNCVASFKTQTGLVWASALLRTLVHHTRFYINRKILIKESKYYIQPLRVRTIKFSRMGRIENLSGSYDHDDINIMNETLFHM